MQIAGRDSFLEEPLEFLDTRFAIANGDPVAAWNSLGPAELEFIDGEIEVCATDYRYYSRNYHIIQTEYMGLRTLEPFWDSQEIFYEQVARQQKQGKPVKLVILKARQLGLSTICESLLFHKTIFTHGCNSLVVAQDPGQADYLFGMSRLAYDSLPWWMKPEARYEAKGRYLTLDRKDSTERSIRPGLKSQIFVEAANKMTGVSVGRTIRAWHASELSLWTHSKILTEQIFPCLNAPDGISLLESTARGRKNFWYKLWRAAEDGKIAWVPVFIESFRVKKYFIPITDKESFVLTDDEKAIRSKVQAERAVTITDEHFNWRRKKIEEFIELEGDEWKFYQEYPSVTPIEAFQGSGICAFNKRKLHSILATTCCPPVFYGEIELPRVGDQKHPRPRLYKVQKGDRIPPAENHGARLQVWQPPKKGASYYIAVDVAHGVQGGDFSCAQVIKIGRGIHPDEQVAEWHGWINPTPFGSVVVALGLWYNTAQIAIELNDVGNSTNIEVLRVLEYPNLFRWKHMDKLKNFLTNWTGWVTNAKTRGLIISKFREAIDDGTLVIRSSMLIEEAMDFGSEDVRSKRFEGQEGNDDRLMAIMIARYCAHDSDWGQQEALLPPETAPDKWVQGFNTDYSPIYDNPESNLAKLIAKENIPTEARDEMQLYADMGLASDSGTDDGWRTV